jgi:hypothetical protein
MSQEPLEAVRSFWAVVFSASRDVTIVIMLIVFIVGAWRQWFVFGWTFDESRAEVAKLRELHSRALDAALDVVHEGEVDEFKARIDALDARIAVGLADNAAFREYDDAFRERFHRPELRAIAQEAEQVGSGHVRRRVLVRGGLPRREPQIFAK